MMARPRRRAWLVVGLLLVALASIGAWRVAGAGQTPEEAAARVTEPPPGWITVPVEQRSLVQTAVGRGAAAPAISIDITAPASVDGVPVVTVEPPAPGTPIVEGDRVVQISGRPVFVLAGDTSLYRSLEPGMSGADVSALQAALDRLGLGPELDGTFGPSTSRAVNDLYGRFGESTLITPDPGADELAAADQALDDARARATLAAEQLRRAEMGVPASEIAQLESAYNQAVRARDAAVTGREVDLQLAGREVDAAERELSRVLADPQAGAEEVAAAELAVEQVRVALIHVDLDTGDALETAAEALGVAALALAEARSPHDLDEVTSALAAANDAVSAAEAELAMLRSRVGPTVPLGEIVFVSSLPARVAPTVDAEPNADRAPLARLIAGDVTISVELPGVDRSGVGVGDRVDLLDESTGIEHAALVVATAPGAPIVVRPVTELPAELIGAELRVTITSWLSDESSLLVPVTALTMSPSGIALVSIVARPGDAPVAVEVEPGRSAGGLIVIVPQSGNIADGDMVVVGR